jgi:arsenite methyltransferase
MLADTRFAPHFDFSGDSTIHRGIFDEAGASLPFAADSTPASSACC